MHAFIPQNRSGFELSDSPRDIEKVAYLPGVIISSKNAIVLLLGQICLDNVYGATIKVTQTFV